MNNRRIYSIGKKISTLVKKSVTPTEALVNLKNEKTLDMYYQALGPDKFVKLIIAVYCNQNGISFSQFESILDKLFFAVIFYTEGAFEEEDCEECNGGGTINCDYCDGDGNRTCDECSGSGDIQCEKCEGFGNLENEEGEELECPDCNGNGEVNCPECEDGYVRCNECDGSGYDECQQCDGNGQIVTDEKIYYVALICSWDDFLKNKCELSEGNIEPISASDELDSKNDIIFLETERQTAELEEDVEDYEYYCIEYLGDTPDFPKEWQSRVGNFRFSSLYDMRPFLL